MIRGRKNYLNLGYQERLPYGSDNAKMTMNLDVNIKFQQNQCARWNNGFPIVKLLLFRKTFKSYILYVVNNKFLQTRVFRSQDTCKMWLLEIQNWILYHDQELPQSTDHQNYLSSG